MRVDSVSLLSTRQRQSDLRDQIHREFVNRPFQFHKRSLLLIRAHKETLSIVAMHVCNPDRSPVGINRRNTAPTPTGLAEIVCYKSPGTIWRGEIARAREQLLVEKSFSRSDRLIRRGLVNRVLVALLASHVVGSALGNSTEPNKLHAGPGLRPAGARPASQRDAVAVHYAPVGRRLARGRRCQRPDL